MQWKSRLVELVLLSILSIGTTTSYASAKLSFSRHGELVEQLTLNELKARFKVHQVEVIEPHVNEPRKYSAFRLKDLMEAFYGKRWFEGDELLMTCLDGYQPSLPVASFAQGEAYLAFAELDKDSFRIYVPDKREELELGPFYLVWASPQALLAWPYQVHKLDLIRFEDRFAAMLPPNDQRDKLRQGFLAYRQHCMSCHRINGLGGLLGRDLNQPVNVTEYWKIDWLKRWIDQPNAIYPETTMPGLASDLANRQQVIDSIVDYLQAMKKVRPK